MRPIRASEIKVGDVLRMEVSSTLAPKQRFSDPFVVASVIRFDSPLEAYEVRGRYPQSPDLGEYLYVILESANEWYLESSANETYFKQSATERIYVKDLTVGDRLHWGNDEEIVEVVGIVHGVVAGVRGRQVTLKHVEGPYVGTEPFTHNWLLTQSFPLASRGPETYFRYGSVSKQSETSWKPGDRVHIVHSKYDLDHLGTVIDLSTENDLVRVKLDELYEGTDTWNFPSSWLIPSDEFAEYFKQSSTFEVGRRVRYIGPLEVLIGAKGIVVGNDVWGDEPRVHVNVDLGSCLWTEDRTERMIATQHPSVWTLDLDANEVYFKLAVDPKDLGQGVVYGWRVRAIGGTEASIFLLDRGITGYYVLMGEGANLRLINKDQYTEEQAIEVSEQEFVERSLTIVKRQDFRAMPSDLYFKIATETVQVKDLSVGDYCLFPKCALWAEKAGTIRKLELEDTGDIHIAFRDDDGIPCYTVFSPNSHIIRLHRAEEDELTEYFKLAGEFDELDYQLVVGNHPLANSTNYVIEEARTLQPGDTIFGENGFREIVKTELRDDGFLVLRLTNGKLRILEPGEELVIYRKGDQYFKLSAKKSKINVGDYVRATDDYVVTHPELIDKVGQVLWVSDEAFGGGWECVVAFPGAKMPPEYQILPEYRGDFPNANWDETTSIFTNEMVRVDPVAQYFKLAQPEGTEESDYSDRDYLQEYSPRDAELTQQMAREYAQYNDPDGTTPEGWNSIDVGARIWMVGDVPEQFLSVDSVRDLVPGDRVVVPLDSLTAIVKEVATIVDGRVTYQDGDWEWLDQMEANLAEESIYVIDPSTYQPREAESYFKLSHV